MLAALLLASAMVHQNVGDADAIGSDGSITWVLDSVVFDSGATASGYFTYEPNVSPADRFFDAHILVDKLGTSVAYTSVMPEGPTSDQTFPVFLATDDVTKSLTGVERLNLDLKEFFHEDGDGRITISPDAQRSVCGDSGCMTELDIDRVASGSIVAATTWFLEGVQFENGDTAVGSFDFAAPSGPLGPTFVNIDVEMDIGASTVIHRSTRPGTVNTAGRVIFVAADDAGANLAGVPFVVLELTDVLTGSATEIDMSLPIPGLSGRGLCGGSDCSTLDSFENMVQGRVVQQLVAPTIMSAASVAVEENQIQVIDVAAADNIDSENDGLTYQIVGGADAARFVVDTDTGVITFTIAPNFEVPRDVGANNVYDVQVRVADFGGLTAVQDIAVTITNVEEDTTPPTAAPFFDGFPFSDRWMIPPIDVAFNWVDELGGSGIDAALCQETAIITTEGAAVSVSGDCFDLAGNRGAFTPTVKVDGTAPQTTFISTPAATISSDSATFEFEGTDALAGVQFVTCTLVTPGSPSGITFGCESPYTRTGLIAGTHTLSVAAADFAGNRDQTPATFTFDVDLGDRSQPTAFPTFTPGFTGSGWFRQPVTVMLDWTDEIGGSGIDNSRCDQTVVVATEGARQAIPNSCFDIAGNRGEYGGQVSIDLTAPKTRITSAPTKTTSGTSAIFEFDATDALSGPDRFVCTFRPSTAAQGPALPCVSPYVRTGLADGDYTFSVAAVDVAGNADATPALHDFTVAPCVPHSFGDVPEAVFFTDAVQWAFCNGVTTGTTAATFSPRDPVTRAQIATFLWRANGELAAAGANPFADVPSGVFFTEAVNWLAEEGITTGTTATTFSPNQTVTRAQMATFLWRATGRQTGPSSGFVDVPDGVFYTDAVNWMASTGITTGTTATTFSPNDPLTRSQAVTFLWRYYDQSH